mmetsp:Transcript_31674/g.62746  ORF Transcript_31674/g.62746 Transcript_31674/m.62746 type:complete len:98 (+) Transcript_31674:87-380(+)|eukprot:CAMPEP_0194305030 /NCGR_PEP_ID=MMETSP0171-20130528/2565_1 /TAXON_ID=218684 /ORGANISM="Corethron pennatum, Strain L29A3" /LENGTH=97 /DNA_ID=CAMNT_0039056435 /DNA_START=87 /DNA_END=380 /DNA_ORIENTATION=+
MENIQNLPPYQQQALMVELGQIQMKESIRTYNKVVYECYDTCVHSFRAKSLDKWEKGCVDKCAARFIKTTQRVGLRFGEYQAKQQESAVAAAASLAK